MHNIPISALLSRLTPVLLVTGATALFIHRAEAAGPYVGRNMLPLALCVMFFGIALIRNRGHWMRPDRRWTLGAIGYAVPALGLSVYLHASWYYDFDGIASGAESPDLLFRFLPYYAVFAGLIGFAIGWIIGKNVPPPRA